jgi:hypothetical protein
MGGANLIGEGEEGGCGPRVLNFTTTSREVARRDVPCKTGWRSLSPISCFAPVAKVLFPTSFGLQPFIGKIAQLWDRITYELTH